MAATQFTSNNRRIALIDTTEKAREAIKRLLIARNVALDCEGNNLSRNGALTLLQICSLDETDSTIYLFDVLTLEQQENGFLRSGMRAILENTRILKIVYDFRSDYEALYWQHNIDTKTILDLQVHKFLQKTPHLRDMESDQMRTWFIECVNGGKRTCGPLFLASLNPNRRHDDNPDKTWTIRPLDKVNILYAAGDIEDIAELYNQYRSADSKYDRALLQYSGKYARMFKSLERRSNSQWECNNIFPLHVLMNQSTTSRECRMCHLQVPVAAFMPTKKRCLRCWFKHRLSSLRTH